MSPWLQPERKSVIQQAGCFNRIMTPSRSQSFAGRFHGQLAWMDLQGAASQYGLELTLVRIGLGCSRAPRGKREKDGGKGRRAQILTTSSGCTLLTGS